MVTNSVGNLLTTNLMHHIGGPGYAMFASYSAVIMVIGGSGITFALSTIQDMVQKGLRDESRVKVIELVWIVQSPGILFFSSKFALLTERHHCRVYNTTVANPHIVHEFMLIPNHLCALYSPPRSPHGTEKRWLWFRQ